MRHINMLFAKIFLVSWKNVFKQRLSFRKVAKKKIIHPHAVIEIMNINIINWSELSWIVSTVKS